MTRLKQLDGARGFAVVLVMACHLVMARSGTGGWRVVEWIGASGVDLFFVLSGFLITSSWLRHSQKASYLRVFILRRAVRIIPLYYLVLVVFGVLLPLLFPAGHLYGDWITDPVSHIFFVSNFQYLLSGGFPRTPLSPSWSLAIEMQFYLLWPFVLYLSRTRFISVCLWIVVAALVVRFTMMAHGGNLDQVTVFTFARFDTFALGAMLAYAWAHPELWKRVSPYLPCSLAVTACLALTCWLAEEVWPSLRGLLTPSAFLFVALAYTSFVGVLLRAPRAFANLFLSRHLISWGRFSYGIYLTNLGVAFGTSMLVDYYLPFSVAGTLLTVVSTFLISFLLGKTLFVVVESPLLKWKEKYPYTEDS